MIDVDVNGVAYLPLPNGFDYGKESLKPKENFRPDGSYRLDFPGVRPMVAIGGYLKTGGPASEEDACKLLGTHSSKNKNSGSYVVGITLDGKRVRLRKEIHPNYTGTLKKEVLNLGDLRNRWVGIYTTKINMGDKVGIDTYFDNDPFDEAGKPKNNWNLIFSVVDNGKLAKKPYAKVWLKPSIPTKGQNTLRVDEQDKKSFSYKYVFCREIVAI